MGGIGLSSVFRKFAAVAAVAVAATFAPMGAHAAPCDSNIVIFSGNSNVGAVNSNAAACVVDDGTTYDGRLINPGSDFLSVRYTVDLGDSVPSLQAHLKGLGFDQDITLKREFDSTLSFWSYNSDDLTLDPTQQGCIAATVQVDPADPSADESTTWHTIGQMCA